MTKQSVLCLFGGKSTEYKVSLMSVCSVLSALNREKYDVHTVGITEDGRWFYYSGGTDAIRDDTWHIQKHLLRRAMLSPSFGERTLYVRRRIRFRPFPSTLYCPLYTAHTARTERCRDCSP